MHNAGMIDGYARVSTDAQDLSRQVARLKIAGCGTIFRVKISGARGSSEPSGATTICRPPDCLIATGTCAFPAPIDRPLCGS